MQCMAAQEGSEASVASSPLPPPPPSSASSSWWRDMHPYSSWPPPAAPRWAPPQPQSSHHHHTSSSGADDDLSASNATMTSFTNTSTNHSGLSIDSSGPNAAAAVATESHLWNQVLMGTAGGEVERSMQVHDARDDSENFLELLNSRTLAPELFAEPPACDYLKKMEYGSGNQPSSAGTWPDVHHFNTSATVLQKHLSSSGYAAAVPERLTANLSDLVSNWSLAPPCDNPPAEAMGGHVKHEMEHNASICHGVMMEAGGGTTAMGLGYSSMLGLSNRMFGGGGGGGGGGAFMDLPWSNNAGPARTLTDLISFGGPLGKAVVAPAKTGASEYKKQGQEISSPVKTSSSSKGSATTSEGKKKRSDQEHGAEGNLKKSKHETSSPTSSLKSQVPKVKLGDKITALQQIVSPFGKTDTASVLYEAINYIKWLHEQVQLLSDPYMKSSSSKDYNAWGGLERKEKAETEADLRSRGLCLVPVSCTPQVYRDNTGPDYWTPPYRSCLYR